MFPKRQQDAQKSESICAFGTDYKSIGVLGFRGDSDEKANLFSGSVRVFAYFR